MWCGDEGLCGRDAYSLRCRLGELNVRAEDIVYGYGSVGGQACSTVGFNGDIGVPSEVEPPHHAFDVADRVDGKHGKVIARPI